MSIDFRHCFCHSKRVFVRHHLVVVGEKNVVDDNYDENYSSTKLTLVCSLCVCSLLTAVCVHLDGLNFRVWVTILDNTSHYLFYYIFITMIVDNEILALYRQWQKKYL